jgi:transaldolase
MDSERLHRLHAAGQAIWLDYIDRAILRNGELTRRIREDFLTGMTSNPTIFEKALATGDLYDPQISAAHDQSAWELFELLETDDVRAACDAFAGVYRETGGNDGYVSIEVSPGVAHDAAATVREARRLWQTVGRPNLMVKVPGTLAGATAIELLIIDGINVNVTLLFSVAAHERVMQAYIRGLEKRLAAGSPIDSLASVASFFVSRVDTEIDARLEGLVSEGKLPAEQAQGARGRAAIANARMAYSLFRETFSGHRWEVLREKGARVQRPLWASTSTKNPAYRDVMYVEQLIGPDTVNTLPPATIEAFRDHGEVERTIDVNIEAEWEVLARLAEFGISMEEVTDKLLADGLTSFQKSFDSLIAGLERKSTALHAQYQASH